jgi:hypothetical protein
MPESARYYLGRVIKLGELSTERLYAAIRSPAVVRLGQYLYTFTDIVIGDDLPAGGYIFARLTKYRPTGEVRIVVPEQHVATIADVPNLLYASSPFIYLPEFSGIAYQHIWTHFPYTQFEKVFAILVREHFQGLFVDTSIEPIADLRTFVERISTLDSVTQVEATVHPPNPLFGPLWDSLRTYMRNRNAGELRISEESNTVDGLTTNVPRLARAVLDTERLHPIQAQDTLGTVAPGIADAAILMAADGYGKAMVRGRSGRSTLTVRTSQSHINFPFDRDPDPDALYDEVRAILLRINDERYLEHP